MAADLSTLTGFAFRYSLTGYTGPADDVISPPEYGTTWTDDAGANAVSPTSGSERRPSRSAASGVSMISPTRASNGAQLCNIFKLAGTNLNCAGLGVVLIGRNASGTDGGKRNICCIGTSGGGGEAQFGVNAAGILTASASADANIRTSGLRLPSGRFCAAWQVANASGGSSFMKVMGFPAFTGAGISAAANNAWLRLFHDGAGNGRWTGGVEEIAFFNTATAVSDQIDAIEAYARENRGVAATTIGSVICAGDSYGAGMYNWFTDQAWPGDVARALPGWMVSNNCRSGRKIAEVLSNAATDLYAAADRLPDAAGKPLAFILDVGKNDIITDRTLGQMQADMTALVADIRANFPKAGIAVCTQNSTGILTGLGITSKETVKAGFNAWLVGGGLAAYGVRVIDVAGVAGFVPAGTSQAEVEAVVLSNLYEIWTTTPSATNDRTHTGPRGQALMAPVFRLGAAKLGASLLGDNGKLLRFGRTADLGIGAERFDRLVN